MTLTSLMWSLNAKSNFAYYYAESKTGVEMAISDEPTTTDYELNDADWLRKAIKKCFTIPRAILTKDFVTKPLVRGQLTWLVLDRHYLIGYEFGSVQTIKFSILESVGAVTYVVFRIGSTSSGGRLLAARRRSHQQQSDDDDDDTSAKVSATSNVQTLCGIVEEAGRYSRTVRVLIGPIFAV